MWSRPGKVSSLLLKAFLDRSFPFPSPSSLPSLPLNQPALYISTSSVEISTLIHPTIPNQRIYSKRSRAACKSFKMTIVEMCVHMDCSGCESKIRKALSKLRGVDGVEIDMANQKVTVTGWLEQKKVLKAVRRTGRRAILWPYQLSYMSNNNNGAEHYNAFRQEYYQLHHPTPAHHVLFNAQPHSYNYYKHGYDDSSLHGYYQYQEPQHTHILGDDARVRFSDDNPNACSIM